MAENAPVRDEDLVEERLLRRRVQERRWSDWRSCRDANQFVDFPRK